MVQKISFSQNQTRLSNGFSFPNIPKVKYPFIFLTDALSKISLFPIARTPYSGKMVDSDALFEFHFLSHHDRMTKDTTIEP
jgi:hypothetical protein